MTFAQPLSHADRALRRYKNVITSASINSQRSLQKAIGPSEVGDPCARKLAYRLLGLPQVNISDPLPSIVGTGAHAEVAAAFERENSRLGYNRYLIEQRVQCGVISGSCDLYDADEATVCDWKFPGPASLAKYKTGPSQVYRTQVHTYGYGHAQAGRLVERVQIVYWPRGGSMAGAGIFEEPYDEAIALAAAERLMAIAAATDIWMNSPGGTVAATIAAIPPTPSELCAWCSFWAPEAAGLESGCPGNSNPQPA